MRTAIKSKDLVSLASQIQEAEKIGIRNNSLKHAKSFLNTQSLKGRNKDVGGKTSRRIRFADEQLSRSVELSDTKHNRSQSSDLSPIKNADKEPLRESKAKKGSILRGYSAFMGRRTQSYDLDSKGRKHQEAPHPEIKEVEMGSPEVTIGPSMVVEKAEGLQLGDDSKLGRLSRKVNKEDQKEVKEETGLHRKNISVELGFLEVSRNMQFAKDTPGQSPRNRRNDNHDLSND
ncbi:hypothetical protein AAMO2058_000278500 [Amorphochlora amoebiformis]